MLRTRPVKAHHQEYEGCFFVALHSVQSALDTIEMFDRVLISWPGGLQSAPAVKAARNAMQININ